MSIEDSGALGEVFRSIPDKSVATIHRRLKIFEEVRKGRASVVQLISHVPYFEDGVKTMWDELRKQMDEEKLPPTRKDFRPWLFTYNVLDDSKRILQQSLQRQRL
jgi:hypothetical protein